jgi:MEMO1 family protein
MIRSPAVAGRFYPGDPVRLTEQLDAVLATGAAESKVRAMACVVPHAGYVYSGHVAGAVYRRMEIAERAILIGPRHYPRGAPVAILSDRAWQTPLGVVPVDSSLAAKIARSCPLIREDEVAHRSEHSLEVQLPFFQRLASAFAFVPIVIGMVRYDELEVLGHAIADVLGSEPARVLLVASTDMNHYEADDVTRVKDAKAIEQILALEPRGLFDTVRKEDISMCGYGATVVMLAAARKLGASRAELVRYATSGEINGDFQQVVGYAGLIIS